MAGLKEQVFSQVCCCCKEEKLLQEFSPRKDRPLGHHYKCKNCFKETARKRRANIPLSKEQKEVAKLRSRQWRQQKPYHRNALKAAYKASVSGATPTWLSKSQKEQILFMYELAKECGIITGNKYQVDHIVPIRGKNVCGLHVPWNLQVLPEELNRRKSNVYEC